MPQDVSGERNIRANERLEEVKRYMRDRDFPFTLQKVHCYLTCMPLASGPQCIFLAFAQRVRSYFKYYLDRTSVFDERVCMPRLFRTLPSLFLHSLYLLLSQAVFREVNYNLRAALTLQIHQELIQTVPFLRESENIFVTALVPNLRPLYQISGSFVYEQVSITTTLWCTYVTAIFAIRRASTAVRCIFCIEA